MVTINDLEEVKAGWEYRIPNTGIVIWTESPLYWYVQDINRENCFLWRNLKWVKKKSAINSYVSLNVALYTYNRSITKVLPLHTDIIDNHKIE